MQTRPIVVITGASSGIGSQLARLFSKTHAVGLIARREDKLNALAGELSSPVSVAACDVSDREALVSAIRKIESELGGRVECLIANAGFSQTTSVRGSLSESSSEMIKTNYFGMIYAIEAVLPHMIEQGRGHIVGVSSLAGFVAAPGSGGYAASKAAMRLFLEGLRREVSARGVVVSTICPGFIKTPLTARNLYGMPFLMDLEKGTQKIYDAILAQKKIYCFPWQMVWLLRLGRLLPIMIQDRLLKKRTNQKSSTPAHSW